MGPASPQVTIWEVRTVTATYYSLRSKKGEAAGMRDRGATRTPCTGGRPRPGAGTS